MNMMNAKFSWRWYQSFAQGIATLFRCRVQAISIIFCLILMLMTPLVPAAAVEDFIPKDLILYVKLQDIDEVYGEIELSENWEKALALLPELSDWQEMQQGLAMLQGMLGTNPLGVIETVGYRTALAVWLDDAGEPQIGGVIHSGGNLDRLQQFTKIVEGLLGMASENTLRLDAGVYQRVRYNALERFDSITKYGFVGDFLVIGAGEGSFEKLMDTYSEDSPSIQQNPEFAEALKKTGSGEAIVFANVPPILPVIGFAEWERRNLATFQSVFGRLNLLETGSFLQVAAQFTPNPPDNEIEMFLKEGSRLETLNAVSGEEDLFVAVAPRVLEGVWELALTEIGKDTTGGTDEAISFLEGLLNLDLDEDIIAGLTGELALSVSDLTHFDPEALSGIRVDVDGAFAIDAGDVETNGGIIFRPSNRMKWNLIGNSLSNLQNASVSQMDYKGITVSAVASSIYHSEVDELFLMSFSEEQVYALIDRIKQEKQPSYLKRLPETPTAFVQLNLAGILEMEKGPPPVDKLLVDSKEIPLLLSWLSVENDTALLEVTLSEKETPIEMLAKLVPYLLWNIGVQWEQSD